MRREAQCSGETLYDTVTELLADPDRLAEMGGAMRRMGKPDATEAITKMILEIMKT
jgi:UDP-N-acetylglucosamine:LPS N-acetylglucosamine transferase